MPDHERMRCGLDVGHRHRLCDQPIIPQPGERHPLNLCANHAQEAYEVYKKHRAVLTAEARIVIAEDESQSLVYYVRLPDGNIKIGRTVDLRRRVSGLRLKMSDVLAIEPGGVKQEHHRHLQFAHLRIDRRENFVRNEWLDKHIIAMRQQHGDPQNYQRLLDAS